MQTALCSLENKSIVFKFISLTHLGSTGISYHLFSSYYAIFPCVEAVAGKV